MISSNDVVRTPKIMDGVDERLALCPQCVDQFSEFLRPPRVEAELEMEQVEVRVLGHPRRLQHHRRPLFRHGWAVAIVWVGIIEPAHLRQVAPLGERRKMADVHMRRRDRSNSDLPLRPRSTRGVSVAAECGVKCHACPFNINAG